MRFRQYRFQGLRKTEVKHLDGAIGSDLHIGWLQIAMDDALLVSGFEGFGYLSGDRQRLIDGNRPLRNAISKRRTLNQLHHERLGAVVFFQAVHVRDVWMIERGEDLCFALKSSEPFRVRREGLRKDLQGVVPLKRHVVRSPDPAHSALTEGGRHLVRTDSGARADGHSEGILRRVVVRVAGVCFGGDQHQRSRRLRQMRHGNASLHKVAHGIGHSSTGSPPTVDAWRTGYYRAGPNGGGPGF